MWGAQWGEIMAEQGFSEEPFRLKNDKGDNIYGIVHVPTRSNGVLVVMFNIGLHYRVGHSRLFVRQARHLQGLGFTVARLDTSRVGYSHGEMPTGRAIDTYDAVQTGLFKDDARLVIRYLMDRFGPRKTFLTGLCGGALTAIIAASMEKDVDGVVFVAGPVTVTSPEYELSTMHPVAADIVLRGYFRKLFSLKSWARFFGGKTTYSRLLRALKTKLRDRFGSKTRVAASGPAPEESSGEQKGDIFNPAFYRAFDDMMKSGRDILFIMPELDRAAYDFRRFFEKSILKNYDGYRRLYSIARVEKADHTFSRPVSSRKLFEITAEWLTKRAGA